MMSRRLTSWARALGLAGAALAVTACVSTPAPIVTHGQATPTVFSAPSPREAPPRIADYAARLQCVPFARRASGIEIYGDAYTWWDQAAGRYPRSSSPAPGSVLAVHGYTNPGRRGHVAVVREIVSERVILVDHANWLNNGEISVNVPVMDVSPDNDWSEIRVWHIPGEHWGGRVYRAQGFIHPFVLHAAAATS